MCVRCSCYSQASYDFDGAVTCQCCCPHALPIVWNLCSTICSAQSRCLWYKCMKTCWSSMMWGKVKIQNCKLFLVQGRPARCCWFVSTVLLVDPMVLLTSQHSAEIHLSATCHELGLLPQGVVFVREWHAQCLVSMTMMIQRHVCVQLRQKTTGFTCCNFGSWPYTCS